MKKTFLLFFATIACIACKKDSPKPESKEPKTTVSKASACLTFKEYNRIASDDIYGKLSWLYKYGGAVCETSLDSAAATHVAQSAVLIAGKKTYEKNRKKIEELIDPVQAYEQYVTFEMKDGEISKMILTKYFTEATACYSVPLFRTIFRKHKVSELSYLSFKQATVNGDFTILIEVNDESSRNAVRYDFSNEPRKKGIRLPY